MACPEMGLRWALQKPQKVKFHLPSRFWDALRYSTPREISAALAIEESSPQLAVEPKQEQLESDRANTCEVLRLRSFLFLACFSIIHFHGWRIVLF